MKWKWWKVTSVRIEMIFRIVVRWNNQMVQSRTFGKLFIWYTQVAICEKRKERFVQRNEIPLERAAHYLPSVAEQIKFEQQWSSFWHESPSNRHRSIHWARRQCLERIAKIIKRKKFVRVNDMMMKICSGEGSKMKRKGNNSSQSDQKNKKSNQRIKNQILQFFFLFFVWICLKQKQSEIELERRSVVHVSRRNSSKTFRRYQHAIHFCVCDPVYEDYWRKSKRGSVKLQRELSNDISLHFPAQQAEGKRKTVFVIKLKNVIPSARWNHRIRSDFLC